jgi:hypothetical protein
VLEQHLPRPLCACATVLPRRGLQRHREPRSTSFWSVACPLSPAGHCAARGPRAHHRVDQLAGWPRSAVRFTYISELSYALFARARASSKDSRILKACHLLQLVTYPQCNVARTAENRRSPSHATCCDFMCSKCTCSGNSSSLTAGAISNLILIHPYNLVKVCLSALPCV